MTKLRLDAGSITVEPLVLSPDSAVVYDVTWITDDGPLPATGTCRENATCVITCDVSWDLPIA